jgi:hypothetical protein
LQEHPLSHSTPHNCLSSARKHSARVCRCICIPQNISDCTHSVCDRQTRLCERAQMCLSLLSGSLSVRPCLYLSLGVSFLVSFLSLLKLFAVQNTMTLGNHQPPRGASPREDGVPRCGNIFNYNHQVSVCFPSLRLLSHAIISFVFFLRACC